MKAGQLRGRTFRCGGLVFIVLEETGGTLLVSPFNHGGRLTYLPRALLLECLRAGTVEEIRDVRENR